MAYAFVSCSNDDRLAVDTIVGLLEAHDVRCWIAPRDIPSGASWAATIVDAISKCGLFLLFLSKSSAASPHVVREVERAVHYRRLLLVVRLDATEPKGDLE